MISPLTKVSKVGDSAQVTTNTSDVAANTAQAVTNAAGIVGLLALSAATTGDVTALDTRVTATESATTSNTANVTTLDTRVTATESATTSNTANAITLDTRVTATESATTSNTANVTVLQNSIAALPTFSEVSIISNAGNSAQDTVNAATFATITQNATKADQTTTYTKSEVTALLAALPAGGWTNAEIQALLDAKGSATTLANVISGAQTLTAANVSGAAVIGGSLQSGNITSSGSILGTSWLSLAGIPANPVNATVYCGNLDATNGGGQIDCFALNCQLYITCASLTQTAPPAGTVLKQSMITANWGTVSIAPGYTTVVFTTSYSPVSSTSDLHILMAGQKALIPGSGSDGYYTVQMHVGGIHAGHSYHVFTGDRSQSPLSYPMLAKYQNGGTSNVTILIKGSADQNANTDDSMTLTGAPNTFLQITEVAR